MFRKSHGEAPWLCEKEVREKKPDAREELPGIGDRGTNLSPLKNSV